MRVRRWKPFLERKMKAGHVGMKQRVPLDVMPAGTLLAASGVRRALATARAGSTLKSQLASLVPVLLNRYQRDYFGSSDGRLRLTVDRRQRYSAFRRVGGGAPTVWLHLDEVVLELKYAVGDDELADTQRRRRFRSGSPVSQSTYAAWI